MADSYAQTTTPTKTYSLVKIEMNTSKNTWGIKTSNNTDTIAEVLTDHQGQIDKRVKLAGDTMTGSLTFQGDDKGIIFHRNTKLFDTPDSHRTWVAKDDFRLYTEDGSDLILQVTPTNIKHGDKVVLSTGNFTPDENYVHVNGGTFKGSVTVQGQLKAQSVALSDKFRIYDNGVSGVINYDAGDYEYYDTSANLKVWVVADKAVMSLDSKGNLYTTANITAFSDASMKENIKPISGADVFKMKGYTYDFMPNDGKRSAGVIAQELQEIAPELIVPTDAGLTVNYWGLTAYLIEGLKALKAEIAEVKAQLAAK